MRLLLLIVIVGCNDSHDSGGGGASLGAAIADNAKSMGSAMVAGMKTTVTGNVHSVGGDIGTWDIVLAGCESGEHEGFYGADFSAAGSDDLRLRYVHDEAMGNLVKVMMPSKPGTARVFDRDATCAVLDGNIERTNVTTWTPKGRMRHVEGHVKFDCTDRDGGHVTGEATFAHCH